MARTSSPKKQKLLKKISSSGKVSYKARSTSHKLGSFFGKRAGLEEEEEESAQIYFLRE